MTNSDMAFRKQEGILKHLYFTRGSDITQITRSIDKLKFIDQRKTNIYALLKKMEDKKWIHYKKCYSQKWGRERRLYYLTLQGLHEFYRLNQIIEGQKWNSYFSALPSFDYKLYRTDFRNIEHHIMTTDLLIDLLFLSEKHPDHVDIANNLMVATKIVKPDLGFHALQKDYFVEVDTGSERGKALYRKFARYQKYFETLQNEKRQLPEAIFFVIPELDPTPTHQQVKRIKSIQNAFLTECEKVSSRVNLVVTSVNDFRKTVDAYVNDKENKLLREIELDTPKDSFRYLENRPWAYSFRNNSKWVYIQHATVNMSHQTRKWVILKKHIEHIKTVIKSDINYAGCYSDFKLHFYEIPEFQSINPYSDEIKTFADTKLYSIDF